ncbi:MAG: hypothetical protein ACUVSF_05710 [Anaerolineae bacterium]
MERSSGHIVQLRVRLCAPIWHIGAGWAALSGTIASGLFQEDSTPPLVRAGVVLLIWLLADPVLGTLWELGTTPHGVWTQLWHALRSADDNVPLILLPYTQTDSPAWRVANWLGRQSAWWRTGFWPQNGEAFITICSLLPVALIIGALLNPAALTLACAAVVLAWLAALWCKRASLSMSNYSWRMTAANAWGQFGIPWMIGCAASSKPSWLGIMLGMCVTFSYMGLWRQPIWQPAVLAGQLAALIIVLGMRQVLAAAGISVLLIAQARLLCVKRPDETPTTQFQTGLHLSMLVIILIASFAIGFG